MSNFANSRLVRWLTSHNPEDNLAGWLRKKALDRKERLIRQTAYKLWEQDGRPENRSQYYWLKAIKKIKSETVLVRLFTKLVCLCSPIEEFLDKGLKFLSSLAIIEILEQLGKITIVIAVISFIATENQRRNAEVYQAWQVITAAYNQTGSGGRIKALEFLNSEPRKNPWFWLKWEKESLSGLDAQKANLVEIKLPNAQLERANFQEARLNRANLQNANLESANFQKAQLEYANFQAAQLDRANFQGANLFEAQLGCIISEGDNLQKGRNRRLASKKEAECEGEGAKLIGADLTKAQLSRANFQNANLENADLPEAKLINADLPEAKLIEANLQNAQLNRANLQNAQLNRANLQNAQLSRAILQEARLNNANLQNAKLWSVNLQEAKLKNVDFREAQLSEANLQGANLQGANLQGANLQGANLQGANLSAAENLTFEQINSACFWEKAIYRGEWNNQKQTFIAIEPNNTEIIISLKQSLSSDSKKTVDCEF